MMRACWLLALAGLVSVVGESPAQFAFGSFSRGNVTLSFGRPRSWGWGGYGYPFGYSNITIIQAYSPPPLVILAPGGLDDQPLFPLSPRQRLLLDLDLVPHGDRGERDDRPRRAPADPFQPKQPPPRPRAADAPRPLPPLPQPPPPLPPAREKLAVPPHAEDEPPPPPPPDPKEEYARHFHLGQEAFAAGEYGRAAHRLRLAAAARPDEPLAHFLLAQALMALGQYREAVAEVQRGMELRPDWPTTGPRPLEAYGDQAADYLGHLRRLEAALAKHPDDPVLLFLSAYFLWFDGRKEEARPLFQRAAPLAPDRNAINRFLQAGPDA